MSLRHLTWFAVLAPIGFVAALEAARQVLTSSGEDGGFQVVAVAVAAVAVVFYGVVFRRVRAAQEQLHQLHAELVATHEAGLDILSELSLDAVLQKVVERAVDLLGTRYGAVAVYDEHDEMHQFITFGVDAEQQLKIGNLPRARGLLGIVLREGQRLRVDDIGEDSRSYGLPPHHPPIHSLLAVPVVTRSPFRGNLYVAEKHDGKGFSDADAAALTRFATQVAMAVDNAYLYAQVEGLAVAEERLRLAREMHDGQAQVLAFVNTKAQAVRAFLNSGEVESAGQHLDQLAAASREIYADVREGILGLRAAVDAENGLADAIRLHSERWQDQAQVPVRLSLESLPRLPANHELQLLRIVQEALANVRKHAAADSATVSIAHRDGAISLRVEDDGQGFNPQALDRTGMPRFGLATMRERAEAIGAMIDIEAAPGEGCRVHVRLPIPERVPLEQTFQSLAGRCPATAAHDRDPG